MKEYFRHYGNLAVIEIAERKRLLTTYINSHIYLELKKMGIKPNTLEWYNNRYIIAQAMLMKLKKK